MNAESERKPDTEDLERKILELERTVHLLEEARSHYDDQYDFAPYGCLTLDRRGCVLELNVTAARMLGRERALIVGMPLLSYIDKPHFADFANHMRRCTHGWTRVATELVVAARNGPRRVVELLSVPVIDLHTEKTVYRTALLDISGRHRAEQALRQSEERFSTAFRASPNPIAITTFPQGRVIEVNPSFCQLLGLKSDRIVGRTTEELGYVADLADQRRMVRDLNRSGDFRDLEMRVRTQSGELREMIASAERIDLSGEQCLLSMWQDVTEIKRLQREVLDVGEREQARIGEDLHDGACQKLAGVAYLADVAARKLEAEKSPHSASVRELSMLVRESIDEVRRLAAGLSPVNVERYGLAWALSNLAEETTARSEAQCRFAMRRPIGITERRAAVHLYRIAQEAVQNAISHGQSRNILLDLATEKKMLRLRIRDDGTGFSRKERKTGLGLHTMDYRAKLLGGTLKVVSSTKRGTTVTCSLPERGVAETGGYNDDKEEDFPA